MSWYNKLNINKLATGTFLLLSLLSLFLSFQFNFMGVAEERWFATHQIDSESFVIGRLVKSREDGILSEGGLLGVFINLPGDRDWNQTDLYIGKISGGTFLKYEPQIGLSGIFFSLLDLLVDKFSSISAIERINFYHAVTSLLLALVLTALIFYLYLELGFSAAFIALLSIIASQWIVVFGDNLYWLLWTMYLPMLAVFALYRREEKVGPFKSAFIVVLIALLFAVKFGAGYEYTTTVALAAISPIIYLAIKNNWNKKLFFQRILLIGGISVVSFVLVYVIYIIQLIFIYDLSFAQTLQWRTDHALTRLHVKAGTFSGEIWERKIAISVIDVFKRYWHGTAFDLKNLFGFENFKGITFGTLVITFIFFSFLVFIPKKFCKGIKENRRKFLALVAVTYFSFFAPLSWYFLAKLHSYDHTHMNQVLWHIPFTIYGFALIGYTIGLVFKDISRKMFKDTFVHRNILFYSK